MLKKQVNCLQEFCFLLELFGSVNLTLSLLVSSADNFCKQIGFRSGTTSVQPDLDGDGDALVVFLKEFFVKVVDFEEKNQLTTKKSLKNFSGSKE